MQKLGGTTISIKPSDASLKKGESLQGKYFKDLLNMYHDHNIET